MDIFIYTPMSHWLFENESYSPDYDDIDYAGFVYRITNLVDGRMYIGRKRFDKKRRLKPLKGKKRRRLQVTESDWRTYTGSCEELNADIERIGKENFRFEILSFHNNCTELNYAELVCQVLLNVLDAKNEAGERIYYNKNIVRRYYPSELYGSERIELFEHYASMA